MRSSRTARPLSLVLLAAGPPLLAATLAVPAAVQATADAARTRETELVEPRTYGHANVFTDRIQFAMAGRSPSPSITTGR